MRTSQELASVIAYAEENPVTAGVALRAEDWGMVKRFKIHRRRDRRRSQSVETPGTRRQDNKFAAKPRCATSLHGDSFTAEA
jgi:hypothetical protein